MAPRHRRPPADVRDDERRPVPWVARPLVWLLAVVWSVVEGIGRGLGWLLDGYVRGANRLGRALTRGARALLRHLGPLGRALLRLARPALRGLRLLWDRLGLRVFLFLARPVGRFGRWVLRWSRPVADRVIAWARRLGTVVQPVMNVLTAVIEAAERQAARIGRFFRWLWTPVRRARDAMSATLRSTGFYRKARLVRR